MTPAELLAPQPPTVPGEDRRPVWTMIEADLEMGRYGPEFDGKRLAVAALARARDAQGRAKYGVPLPVDSGRNSRIDELQEALDGMAYSRQTYEQELRACQSCDCGGDLRVRTPEYREHNKHWPACKRAWARHLLFLRLVLELLEELS